MGSCASADEVNSKEHSLRNHPRNNALHVSFNLPEDAKASEEPRSPYLRLLDHPVGGAVVVPAAATPAAALSMPTFFFAPPESSPLDAKARSIDYADRALTGRPSYRGTAAPAARPPRHPLLPIIAVSSASSSFSTSVMRSELAQ